MKPGVSSVLASHGDDLEHFTVDELQEWIPKRSALQDSGGVLELTATPGGDSRPPTCHIDAEEHRAP